MMHQTLGSWSLEGGINISLLKLAERRTNLTGVTLVNTLMPWDPYCIIERTTNLGNPVDPTGMIIDIFKIFQEVQYISHDTRML